MDILADIIIPSCKNRSDCGKILMNILETRETYGMLHFTGLDTSAAINRNAGLDDTDCPLIIMLDDDITGFTFGWDVKLLQPLLDNENVIGTSARLMNKDGTPAYTMVEDYDLEKPLIYSSKLPTACCAFRRSNLRFDENFIGSGFEDDDYCRQMLAHYGQDKLFATVNACRVIHLNEAKNQRGKYWEHNLKYFNRKWDTINTCEYKTKEMQCIWNLKNNKPTDCNEQNCQHGRFK